MTLGEVELVVDELLVIFFNVTRASHLQKVIARVHELAEGVQRSHHLRHIGNDRLFLVLGKRCHEVVGEGRVDAEFNLLRVYQHELQLIGMLLVE